MGLIIREAKRSNAKPLVGIYSRSGHGKTMSALLLARGFVGASGTIVMIETEAGRGESFAEYNGGENYNIGSYKVIPIRDSFSAEIYGEAISLAEKENADALIIDSASHEWEGIDGVLDRADKNNKPAMLKWQAPKMDHQKYFVNKILQTPIPLVVVCMRAKYPMEEEYDEKGRKTMTRSKELVPKQSEDMLFELFMHGWIDAEHRYHVGKYTRDDLEKFVPSGRLINNSTGIALAEWASGKEKELNQSLDKVMIDFINSANEPKLQSTEKRWSKIKSDFTDECDTEFWKLIKARREEITPDPEPNTDLTMASEVFIKKCDGIGTMAEHAECNKIFDANESIWIPIDRNICRDVLRDAATRIKEAK